MRHHATVTAILTLALLLAACSGTATEEGDTGGGTTASEAAPNATDGADASTETTGATDEEALQRVADAAQNTVEAGSARFSITLESAGTAGEDGVQPISAEGEENFTEQQRRLTFQGPDGELEVIVDGDVVYVQIPGTEDETWARAELSTLLGAETGFGGPAGLPFQSPADNLRALTESVSSAQEAGTEDLEGQTTTRYDLTIDLTQVAEQGPDEEANATFELLAEQSGVTELDMQVWVDEEERIAQVAYVLDLAQANVEAATEAVDAEVEAEGTVSATVGYSDFGADITITLPAEEDIVDLDEEEIRGSFGG